MVWYSISLYSIVVQYSTAAATVDVTTAAAAATRSATTAVAITTTSGFTTTYGLASLVGITSLLISRTSTAHCSLLLLLLPPPPALAPLVAPVPSSCADATVGSSTSIAKVAVLAGQDTRLDMLGKDMHPLQLLHIPFHNRRPSPV